METNTNTPEAKQPASAGCHRTACSACGQAPVQSGRRKADYGDFSEYEVRRLIAEYCMSVTLGCTGWGVPFKVWVELHGIAKHDGMFRLIRLPNDERIHGGAGQPKQPETPTPLDDASC